MTTIALNTADIAGTGAFSDQSREATSSRKPKLLKNRPLLKAFTKASVGVAGAFAVKSAAVSLASSAGWGAVAVAGSAGVAVTAYGAVNDYRAYRAQEGIQGRGFFAFLRGLFSFLGQNKGKYFKKLAINSGLGIIGGAGLVELFDTEAHAQTLDAIEAVDPDVVDEALDLMVFDAPAPVGVTAEGYDIEIVNEALDLLEMDPVRSPLDSLGAYSPADFTGRSAEVFSYALRGEPWAVKEMAASLLYENNGSPVDKALAVDLYNLVIDSDAPSQIIDQARADLAFVDQRWGLDTIMGTDAPAALPVDAPAVEDVPEIVPEITTPLEQLATMTELNDQASALRDAALAGDRQALGDVGIGMLNGWYGFDADLEQGLALMREAADRGSEWHQLQLAILESGGGEHFGVDTDREHAVSVLRSLGESSNARVAGQAQDFMGLLGLETAAPAETLAKTVTVEGTPPLELAENEFAVCDIAADGEGARMQCVLDEDKLQTGFDVRMNWPGQEGDIDLHYVGGSGLALPVADVPIEADTRVISASYVPEAPAPVDCVVNKDDSLINMSCDFTRQAQSFDSPVFVGIPQSQGHIGISFDFGSRTPPNLYTQNTAVYNAGL